MPQKIRCTRYLGFLGLFTFMTLACSVFESTNGRSTSTVPPPSSGIVAVYEGKGTATWVNYSCDTEAVFTMTIYSNGVAEMAAHGPCVSPVVDEQYNLTGKCFEPKPGESCGTTFVSFVSMYEYAKSEFKFNSCTAGEASGGGSINNGVVTGKGVCPSTDPFYNYTFELQLKK